MIFSVVIPVYNVKDYLPKCIDSVLAQDFDDYELVLVDDGSTDGESGAICDRYAAAHPERIRVIHKPNGGLGDARNVGLEAAAGEYLVFIDSDDYIGAGMFRTLAGAIDRFHSDVIDFGFAVDTDGTITKQLVDDLPHDRTFTLAELPQPLLPRGSRGRRPAPQAECREPLLEALALSRHRHPLSLPRVV